MSPEFKQQLCQTLGVLAIDELQTIQSLWSGCGQVARVTLGAPAHGVTSLPDTVVIKHVKMPERIHHPRGWDTDRSAERKVRSYEVETGWYARWSQRCSNTCRVPKHLGHATWEDERLLILEDIDASGFDRRLTHITPEALQACVRWLAAFHATFLNDEPAGLWDKGTYWHLGTRPDEYDALAQGPLKDNAHAIDAVLDASPYQTIVHGDAKLANFCFSNDQRVAAVDFQYVGGGCGIKDLAYLVGGCIGSEDCFTLEDHLLDTYFTALAQSIEQRGIGIDAKQLEADWRRLYPYAWADFERFLQGWSPGHWKISEYSSHMTERALADLAGR